MKNSNNTTGNRTRDLPAGSAVPQTTAPTRTPEALCTIHKLSYNAAFQDTNYTRSFGEIHHLRKLLYYTTV